MEVEVEVSPAKEQGVALVNFISMEDASYTQPKEDTVSKELPKNTFLTKRVFSIFAAVTVSIVAIVVIILYLNIASVKKDSNQDVNQEVSPVTTLKQRQDVAQAITNLETNNSKELFATFDSLAKNEKDKSLAQSLKLYAGASLIGVDRNAGAEYYMSVAKDLNNKPFVRAYAMTQIARFASGDGSTKNLSLFFATTTDIVNMSKDNIFLTVNKKILETYPMPGASAVVAKLELRNNKTKENALLLRDLHMNTIVTGVEYFSKVEGLSHFVPGIYLSTAQFLAEAETVGGATTTEVRSYYDKGYKESVSQGQSITKQFIMLSYINYLLSKELKEDAEVVIRAFIAEPLTSMIVTNLSSTKGGDYQYLLSYMTENKTLGKELEQKIGQYLK